MRAEKRRELHRLCDFRPGRLQWLDTEKSTVDMGNRESQGFAPHKDGVSTSAANIIRGKGLPSAFD